MKVRVASVPAGHPYVRQLAGESVVLLTEEPPEGLSAGQWWPPAMFDPDWIRRHSDEFDVYHLHFGMESFGVEHLRLVLQALAQVARPVVFTVHDLQNPQLVDQTVHREQLDLLIPAAQALITLTPGAAAEIERRWHRVAVVVPHPQIVPLDLDLDDGPRPPRPDLLVGMHLKDLRPNIDAVAKTRALIDAIEMLCAAGIDAGCRIEMNDRVRDEVVADRITDLCAGSDRAVLRRHPRLADPELFDALLAVDVCVLPYGSGTHSGWLEMCWDLGVPVVAPSVGHYADQHPDPAFCASVDTDSPRALALALLDLYSGGAVAGSQRRRSLQKQRRSLRTRWQYSTAAVQHEIYRTVIAGSATG